MGIQCVEFMTLEKKYFRNDQSWLSQTVSQKKSIHQCFLFLLNVNLRNKFSFIFVYKIKLTFCANVL